jgi:hypothetical protein
MAMLRKSAIEWRIDNYRKEIVELRYYSGDQFIGELHARISELNYVLSLMDGGDIPKAE